VRAIICCLFLFACTGDYIDTFWSKDEQVNSCLPAVKYYWGTRGETVYLDESGMEIVVVEKSICKGNACIRKALDRIEVESWIFEESDRYCDVIAHEIGHGLGYQHSGGLMGETFPLDESPIILPVSSEHRDVEWQ
jgi:hypothetical protein